MKRRKTLFSLLFITVFCSMCVFTVFETPPLIRLHILANSDSKEDQVLKYQVRDEIVKLMQEEFKDTQSLEESRTRLLQVMPCLANKAKEYITQEGYSYEVSVVYGNFEFPTKYYGSFALPAGEYEALRLIIGEGKGANWWCVLFPPLCFVDGSSSLSAKNALAVTQEKQGHITNKLELTKHSQITNSNNNNNNIDITEKKVKIKPAFKIAELWQEVF